MKGHPYVKVAECHSHPTTEKAHPGEINGDKAKARLDKTFTYHYARTADGVLKLILGPSGHSLQVWP